MNIPEHIAIIMDGNGRWASAQGYQRIQGHWQGYHTLKSIVYAADEIGVKYLTTYGFSSENWSRPDVEVNGLMDLMFQAMQAELDEMGEIGIRFITSGRKEGLPDKLSKIFQKAAMDTRDNRRLTLNIAVNYGGRAEIVDAVRKLAEQIKSGKLSPQEISEDHISAELYHPELPDPDLLIRTAGEKRISNFLLWESAYSEIWVTPVLWPDFTPEHLQCAINDYQKRVRKFGAVIEQVSND